MALSMVHRGPDKSSVIKHNSVGLTHGMLFSTPESLFEVLPTPCLCDNLLITADIRIDNRDELIDKLTIKTFEQEVITDSSLILHAYHKWGEYCVHHLIGDFAFAIWDERLRQLFCARDHMGVKPLYYYASDSFVAFASELPALLLIPDIPHKLDEARIADFVVMDLEGIDKTCTFYHDIFRLPPAHYLKVDPDSFSIHNYWQLGQSEGIVVRSKKEQQEEFNEIFSRAVKDRLRCNTSAASMLSGGLDSSAIVGIARNLSSENQRILSVYSASGKDSGHCKEYFFSQLITAQGKLHSVFITPHDIWKYEQELMVLLSELGEPFDGHMIMPMILYMTAKKNNTHVLLDGVDGDIPCSISPSYPANLLRQGKFKRALSEIVSLEENYYCHRVPMVELLFRTIKKSYIPGWLRSLKHAITPDFILKNNCIKGSLLSGSSCDKLKVVKRYMTYRQHRSLSGKQSLRDLHIEAITHPDLTVGLERYDRVAAHCSVEPRHPLLDKRLIECAVNLPWDLLVHDGWSKYVLRKCAEDYLPKKVCWRKGKEHVGYDFILELLNNTQMHQLMIDGIRSEKKELSRYIRRSELKQLTGDKTYCKIKENALDLLNVYSLAMWLKQPH